MLMQLGYNSRRRCRALVISAAFSLSALSLTAFARPADASPESHQQALDLFEKGRAAYREGHFQESVDLLTQAYALEKEPVLLYNLARAYEGLGDFEHAAATYQEYLEEGKDVPDRAAILERVANLKKSIAEKAQLAKERDDALKARAEQPKVTPTTPVGEPGAVEKRSPSPVPWIIAGAGVAGVGVGVGLGVAALSKNSNANKASSQVSAVAEHQSAKGLALGSTIAFIAGGVLAAGGATWGIIDLTTRRNRTTGESKPSVGIAIGPMSVGFTGSF